MRLLNLEKRRLRKHFELLLFIQNAIVYKGKELIPADQTRTHW